MSLAQILQNTSKALDEDAAAATAAVINSHISMRKSTLGDGTLTSRDVIILGLYMSSLANPSTPQPNFGAAPAAPPAPPPVPGLIARAENAVGEALGLNAAGG